MPSFFTDSPPRSSYFTIFRTHCKQKSQSGAKLPVFKRLEMCYNKHGSGGRETMQFITHSAEETEALGERLAQTLTGGEVVAYFGELGAGKTAFTRGLARGLGISMRVTSPTYTIVNEYSGGRLPLFHFDMYRLGSSEELFDIGWEDYLARGGVVAVEWSENVKDALDGAITVRIEKTAADERRITIEGSALQ